MWLLFLSLLACAPEPPGPVDAKPVADEVGGRARVRVVVVGDEDAAAMIEVLEELLGRLDVDIALERVDAIDVDEIINPAPAPEPARARVWVAVDDPRQATVYIADAEWSRILVRRVPKAAPALDEVAREEIGHIVETAVDALLAGAEIGLSRREVGDSLGVELRESDAPPSAPPRPRPPPRPPFADPDLDADSSASTSWPRLWLDAGWNARMWSLPLPLLHGPRLGVGAEARRGRIRPGGRVAATLLLPTRFESSGIGVRVDGLSLRASAHLAPEVHARLRLRPSVELGLDALYTTPRDDPASAGWTYVPNIDLGLGFGVVLIESLELRIVPYVNFDLVDARFVGQQTEEVLFDPWFVRPGLRVSLAWDVLDAPNRKKNARGAPSDDRFDSREATVRLQ